jgi:23S rRNA-/tRNA-specific pseudouridylate synthase
VTENDPAIVISGGETPIGVIACGSRWLVADKPCGMSVHNDPGSDLCSLALAAVRAGRLPAVSRDLHALHAAHRIDRDTSGIVLLAGDSETLAFFGEQFAAKTVCKQYLAVVHGSLEGPAADREWIDWNWPLSEAAAGRNDPSGRGKRMPCATRVRIVAHSPHYSLIACEPVTGRKHQIRRHAKLAGHPVAGDRRYGSARSLDYLRRHHAFDRLALHAHILAIRLPGEDRNTTFQSGGLPEPLRRLLEVDQLDGRREHGYEEGST